MIIIIILLLFSRQVFPSGDRVTYTGKEILCQKCVQIPVRDIKFLAKSPTGPCGN